MAPVLLGLSLYLWIALISLILLALFAFTGHFGLDLGGDADADVGVDVGHDFGEFSGPGISPMSPPLVAAFGATFGAVGALLDMQGLSDLLVGIGAAVAATLVAVGLFFAIQRFLVRAQTSSDVRLETLVGRDASVLVPIKPDIPGQILVITEERGRTLLPATSSEDLPRDALVTILGFTGGVASVRKKVL